MKRKTRQILRIAMLVLAAVAVLCMAGCGKDVSIKIVDANVTTEVEANTSMTVREILENAGVTLGEKDETVPEADAKLKDATEITVKRYAKVTVKNGKEEKIVELVGATVSEAVSKAGFELSESIRTDVDEKSFLEDGMTINLVNSIQVQLKADGKTEKCQTFAKTVKEFLAEQNITLDEDDEVSPKLESKIKKGTKVTVKRVEYKEETRTETVPFAVKQTNSSSMKKGTQKVTRAGVNGEKEVTYKVKYVDGKEDSKEVISEKVTKEPVDKLVTVGTQAGKTVVSKQAVYDCGDSSHGYYIITYSDGSVEYKDF